MSHKHPHSSLFSRIASKSRKRARNDRRPQFENLEGRQLLCADLIAIDAGITAMEAQSIDQIARDTVDNEQAPTEFEQNDRIAIDHAVADWESAGSETEMAVNVNLIANAVAGGANPVPGNANPPAAKPAPPVADKQAPDKPVDSKLTKLQEQEEALKAKLAEAEAALVKARQEEVTAKNAAEEAREQAKKTPAQLRKEEQDKITKLRAERNAASKAYIEALRKFLAAQREHDEWKQWYQENPDDSVPALRDRRMKQLKEKLDQAKKEMDQRKQEYETKKDAVNKATTEAKQKDKAKDKGKNQDKSKDQGKGYKEQVRDNKEAARKAAEAAKKAAAERKAAEQLVAKAKLALQQNQKAQAAAQADQAADQKAKDSKAAADKDKARREKEAAEQRKKEAEERAKRIRKAVAALKYLDVIPETFNAEPYISDWIGTMSLVGADATTSFLNLGTVLGGLQAAYGIVSLEFQKLIPSNSKAYQTHGQQRLDKWLQDKGYAKNADEAKLIRAEMELIMGVKSVTSVPTYR